MRLATTVPVIVVLLAGCGAAPDTIDPSGVDQLTIPTPSPRPRDFVAQVDNPLLPLAPGRTWTYRAEEGRTVRVSVLDGTREIAGVATTAVHEETTTAGGRVLEEVDRWFAQDRSGNVWSFGAATTAYRRGVPTGTRSWLAGQDDALAALAMPATPRVGDGYRVDFAPGVAEDVAVVVDVDVSVSVPYADFDGVLETARTTRLVVGLEQHLFFARDVGLVAVESEDGEPELELVTFTP